MEKVPVIRLKGRDIYMSPLDPRVRSVVFGFIGGTLVFLGVIGFVILVVKINF